MRNWLVIFVLGTVCCLTACKDMVKSPPSGREFNLQGLIEGQDTGWVHLLHFEDGSYAKLDSSRLKQGVFSFKGSISIPQRYYVQLANRKSRAAFFMDGGEMSFTAPADSLRGFELEGSSLQDAFEDYNNRYRAHQETLSILHRQVREAQAIDDTVFAKKLQARGDSLYEAGLDESRRYVRTHPHSPVASYVLYRDLAFSSDPDELGGLYDALDPSQSSVPYAQMMAERISLLREVAVGQPVKHFLLPDTSGVSFRSESLKGQYYLIDFWASWCGPCRKENPNVVASYEKYHPKGFEIIGVSLDTDRQKWLGAIEDDGLMWIQVSDLKGWQSSAGKYYGVKAIPHTVLVDPQGMIIARDLRGPSLRDKLEELFDEEEQEQDQE
ncbi:MAG: thioredoxin-like domain-containing protein [Bacteroidia bacterium]